MSNPFNSIVAQCETHAQRMLWAKNKFLDKLPLSAKGLRGLNEAEVAVLDQFISRFAKLQDGMGAKLLPELLELTKEQGELDAYLDKLNRLEKIGALPSVDEWLKLRQMRNAFAHDYPENSELQAAVLNHAFVAADRLAEILHHLKNYAKRYGNE